MLARLEERLGEEDPAGEAWPSAYLSTHPLTAERIRRLEAAGAPAG
jgi:Zn-dependent protease with chaperone function